jgi:hypothetical protein
MGRLQNNPSIGWVYLKSTHVRPLASGNKKTVFFFSYDTWRIFMGYHEKNKIYLKAFQKQNACQKQRKNYAKNTISNMPSNYSQKNGSMSLHFMEWGLRHDHFFVLWNRLDSHRNMLSPVRQHKPILGGSHFFENHWFWFLDKLSRTSPILEKQ